MKVTLTLLVYTGRRNPSWEVESSNPALTQLQATMSMATPIEGDSSLDQKLSLHYGGLLIEGERYAPTTVKGPQLWNSTSWYALDSPADELKLLATMPQAVRDEIEPWFTAPPGIQSIDDLPECADEPGVNDGRAPRFVGDDAWSGVRSRTNNCYNYANDELSNGKIATPGGAGSVLRWCCSELRRRVACDRLVQIGCPSNTISGHAIVICSRQDRDDYHCFRLNREGFWSHKLGTGFVTSCDSKGRRIDSLANAVFDTPLQFCGFFESIPGWRDIK